MFTGFFYKLKEARLPVSLREYLTLLDAVGQGVAGYAVEDFYYLARATLIKDERHLDRFDQVFGAHFKGLDGLADGMEGITAEIPEDWLRKLAEKFLTEAEKAEIGALGGWDKLMETLKQRLEEQKGRHQGGNKWIGTAGTSPFGAYGYNPEGVRIGQDTSRHRRAVKVWDRREFRNLDDSVEIGTRNIKVALRRLRKWARTGAADELDLPGTISSTARQGWLDVQMRPERHNAVKVLMLFDIGGSMDDHVKVCEELFSAVRTEFKHLEYYYFHNCPYEGLWKDNARRRTEQVPTLDVINTYGPDYKLVIVGDATMSPYEITYPGGSVEHWNAEAGAVWLQRLLDRFPHAVWINPQPEDGWGYYGSVGILHKLMSGRMYPLTLAGLDRMTGELNR
ncbi:VWA domain-containing protein [Thalassospira sp.]|uniref:vWA domain-containing protein n=1 Tax=Thalassospira sp. TaxID=1912094 RepID=UPI002736E272|nr:VWA domain-containing protein [Thalassospira sp.]MDP2696718.1 VWA domain-containing protein [Thalassospira sp.]